MKWKRILLIFLIVLITAGIIFVIFLSSIIKYEIEKHSEEYTGRKIKMENLHINLLTGNIRVDKLKIYEAKNQNIFLACDEINITISVHKLLASKYDITEIKIEKPLISIIQKGSKFNYSDLVKRFVTDASPFAKK